MKLDLHASFGSRLIRAHACHLRFVSACSQRDAFIVPNVLLGAMLLVSVLGSLVFAGGLVAVQIVVDLSETMRSCAG